MSESFGQEKVAYVSPSETSWCVSLRDGTGVSGGLYTVNHRRYYDSAEKAKQAAERWVESGKADSMELNVVVKRLLKD